LVPCPALLSLGGSRAVGFKIATACSKHAQALHPRIDARPRYPARLWLGSEPEQEYRRAMEPAGRFASASRAAIHRRVTEAAGLKEAGVAESHHNLARRETKLPEG